MYLNNSNQKKNKNKKKTKREQKEKKNRRNNATNNHKNNKLQIKYISFFFPSDNSWKPTSAIYLLQSLQGDPL